MILGIGFIMVAAMFPVAIHQTEDSVRETNGAAIARAGTEYIEKLASETFFNPSNKQNYSMMVPTVPLFQVGVPFAQPAGFNPTISTGQASVTVPGQVWSLYDTRLGANYSLAQQNATWSALASASLIMPDDNRYGWAVMYKRDVVVPITWNGSTATVNYNLAYGASNAQVIIVPVQSRAKPAYDPVLDARYTGSLVPTLLSSAKITNTVGISTITFNGTPPQPAEGAYIVISDDTLNASDPRHSLLTGRIFRLGIQPNGSTNAWQLAPGSDLTATDIAAVGSSITVNVLIMGRGVDANNNVAGAAQDIAAYSTFVQVPN